MHAPQHFIEIALDHLQRRQPAWAGAMHPLKAEREAGVLQLEHKIVGRGIELEMVEYLEEPRAADAFAEKAAEHRVLSPDVALFGRNMLHDIVGGGAKDVFCRI